MKKLLVAVGVLMGVTNFAWAGDTYFGSDTKECGAWDASSKSKNYILQKGGTITLNFTFSTNDDSETYRLDTEDVSGDVDIKDKKWKKWFTWLIDASCNGWQFAFRADNLNGSNWHGSLTPTITYSDNFETAYTRENMSGASVVLVISRSAGNEVTVLATTTKGETSWWKREVITLGGGAGDSDMTFYLTCDNGYGKIHSVVGSSCVGTTENETVWWNNFSDYFTVAANKTLTLNFKNYSSKSENWNNFSTVITNDYDRVTDDKNSVLYNEHVVLRVDDFGWGTYYDHSKFSNNYNWTSFKNDMDGADVELKIRRLDTKVAVKATYTTTAGQKYYQQYVYTSPSGTDPLRVFLTVDNSHITNLTSSIADTPNSANEYLYTIKAVDGSGNDLSTFATGAYWTDESAITVAIPQYILSGTSLLGVAKQSEDYWYRVSVTPNSADYVHKVTYNNEKISNVVYFTEAENISGFSGSTSPSITARASGGMCARSGGADKTLTTLSAGKYKVYVRGNADGNNRTVTVKAGEETVLDAWAIGSGTDQTTNAEFFVTSNTTITVACNATSTTGLDWVYLQKIGELATIGSTGWTTFSSPYALDLSDITASDGEVQAYYASAIYNTKNKVKVTSTDQAAVRAGEGLMFKGTPDATITIPVVGSGDPISGNLLVGCPNGETLDATANFYVLVNNDGEPEFQSLATNGATIPAGKAYLNAPGSEARLSIVFDDETTGVSEGLIVKSEESAPAVFTLSGQRVAQPAKGLYIVNGKKVVIK